MARLLPTVGSPLPLDPKTPITIGSGDEASLRLTGHGIAEMHCVLRALQGGGWGIKDLGSEAGTKVNGHPVRSIRLHHGDRIQIGAQEIVFDDPEGAAKKPKRPAKAPSKKASTKPREEDPWLSGQTRITGYEIHSLLGSGGMGRVYEATQLSLHRRVAVKVLDTELAKDPKFVESFLLEARASARFNHPNVVQVFDVDECEGRPFYSMELLTESLEEKLKREGRLDQEEAIRVIRDAAKGLAYAEQLGLVHRDVKPDNLMLDGEGRTKLCDLGLAASVENAHEGKMAGTPHFMSPEQIRKTALDARSDLYSLGCTFWRLLTGRTVFSGKTVRDILKAQLETPAPKLREALPEASEELENLLARLLAKDPEERYQDAGELAEDLQGLLDGKQKSHRLLALGLGAVVIVLAVVLVVILNQGPEKEIQVIQQTDPDAARQQQALQESHAEVALLRVPKTGSLTLRAQAFEKVATEHPGTKAGKKAALEARRLRQEQAKIAAAAKKEKQRIAALARSVSEAGLVDRDAGRLEAAWRKSLIAAGSPPRPSAVNLALDRRSQELRGLLKQRIQTALTELKTALKKPEADPVALRELFQKSLRPRGEGLEWTLPGAAELLAPARKEGAKQIRQIIDARAAKMKADLLKLLEQRRTLLLGKGAALELLTAHRFEEAARLLHSLPAPKGRENLWRGIVDLASIAKIADGALASIVASPTEDGKPLVLDLQGDPARLLSYDGKNLMLETGKGRRRKKQELDPWEHASLLEQILAPGRKLPDAAAQGRQALILLLNLCDLVPQGQTLIQGAADGGPPDSLPLDRGRIALLEKTRFSQPAMVREGRAVRLLAELLKAWNAKADLRARDAVARLEEACRTTSVGICLGLSSQPGTGQEDG